MEIKRSCSDLKEKPLQYFLKELADSNSDLQRVKSEREQITLHAQQLHDEMDHRTQLTLCMDQGLMDALIKLDILKKEKQKLENQIHQLTTREIKAAPLKEEYSHKNDTKT